MVACGSPRSTTVHPDFSLFYAEFVGSKGQRDVRRDIQSYTRDGTLCFVKAGDATFNRSILATPGVFALSDLHLAPKNAFDRVCATVAAERNVAVDIRITPLIMLRGVARERTVRLIEEILLLQNRYEFPVIISSGAKQPSELRSCRAVGSLLTGIGMEQDLIDAALTGIPDLIQRKKPLGT
jgi:ribonuclease P/MRP protein subunit RPP1